MHCFWGKLLFRHWYWICVWVVLPVTFLLTAQANATLPSYNKITAVNLPELKKEAEQHFSAGDAETIAGLVKKEATGLVSGKAPDPPFTRMENRRFVEELVPVIKPYLVRGEVERVNAFFEAVNSKKLLKAYSFHDSRQAPYAGPTEVTLSVEVTNWSENRREYILVELFKSVSSSKGKGFRQSFIFATLVKAP